MSCVYAQTRSEQRIRAGRRLRVHRPRRGFSDERQDQAGLGERTGPGAPHGRHSTDDI